MQSPSTDAAAIEPERRLVPPPPPGGWISDEPEMETYRHLMQMLWLIATLRWHWRDRTDFFAGGNLTIYYSPRRRRSEDFRGPDFFVVLGVDGTRDRASWVVWEEGGRYPNVILEILSDSTKRVDRGEKKRLYQDIFRTPEYFLFDPETLALEGLRLDTGRYVPLVPDAAGRLASAQLDLLLGVEGGEVRLYTSDGRIAPKPEEAAVEALRRADHEKRRADDEKRRADEAVAELERLRSRLGQGTRGEGGS